RNLANDECEYLEPSLVALYDLYLSFTGGPTLRFIESHYGSPAARHLACSVDPEAYRPAGSVPAYALGYLGTYSDDRQPAVDRLLFETARRLPMDAFVVAGASYPKTLGWPRNVQHVEHVAPREHPAFYCSQRATLNVTRADMVLAGFSPSVRLFEAAACGVAIISDRWAEIETYFDPGTEIVLADCSDDVIGTLTELDPRELEAIGMRSRARVLREHTARARARELLGFLGEHRGGLRAVG
ncbi:MAG: glycosyltransferase, partial [Polyangiaceae bacterium]|nr:glycosyltransferase [Polyangiaceae bacterium]